MKPPGLPTKVNIKVIRNKPFKSQNIQNILRHTNTPTNKYILAENELTIKKSERPGEKESPGGKVGSHCQQEDLCGQ